MALSQLRPNLQFICLLVPGNLNAAITATWQYSEWDFALIDSRADVCSLLANYPPTEAQTLPTPPLAG